MAALIPFLAGLVLLTLGWLVVRTFGHGLTVGRLLSVTPEVAIGEALEMARRGEERYVRLRGRIDADDPLPDERGRPLVLRLERVDVREGTRWRTVRRERRHVPFRLRDRTARIAIDAAALEEVVVIPREARGMAGEIADRFDAPVDPSLPVRFRIDQVSVVEHAVAVGVPRVVADGSVELGAGMGRPLVLTTLEIPEAMRLLSGGRRRRAVLAGGLLALGLGCLAVALVLTVAPLLFPAAVLGSTPEPTVAPGGDTRSGGEGAGLVGQPLVVALGVVLLGVVAAGLTVLYARLAERGRRLGPDP